MFFVTRKVLNVAQNNRDVAREKPTNVPQRTLSLRYSYTSFKHRITSGICPSDSSLKGELVLGKSEVVTGKNEIHSGTKEEDVFCVRMSPNRKGRYPRLKNRRYKQIRN
ncbi:hypothetical protein KM043_013544 [Ampulex compressa]|nr:hypothetical protein KM043_013544 [Ampulex compressa]